MTTSPLFRAGNLEAVTRHSESSAKGHRESSIRALPSRSSSFGQPDYLQGRRRQVEEMHLQCRAHHFTASLHAQRYRRPDGPGALRHQTLHAF